MKRPDNRAFAFPAEYTAAIEDYADDLEQQLEAIITEDETEIEDEDEYTEEYEYDRPALNDLQTSLVMGYFCERINDNLSSLWELIDESE